MCGNKCSVFFRSVIKSPDDVMKLDIADYFEGPLNVISDTVNGFVDCISKIKRIMHEVKFNSQTLYMCNIYYRIQPEGLQCDY